MARKEFYVMDREDYVNPGEEPYIFKVLVEAFINKLAPLADPENRLIFRVALWCFDAELERKKRVAGVRYYPLQKKLTKITNKVEAPFKVFNQKDVITTLDKLVQEILADPDFTSEVKDTIESYCAKCKMDDWNCKCKPRKEIKGEVWL